MNWIKGYYMIVKVKIETFWFSTYSMEMHSLTSSSFIICLRSETFGSRTILFFFVFNSVWTCWSIHSTIIKSTSKRKTIYLTQSLFGRIFTFRFWQFSIFENNLWNVQPIKHDKTTLSSISSENSPFFISNMCDGIFSFLFLLFFFFFFFFTENKNVIYIGLPLPTPII